MQFPGTSPFGTSGGATALTNQLMPHSLEARKQALIAKLAGGNGPRSNVGSSGYGFPGGLGGGFPFASQFFGNYADGNQFYGPDGQGSPAAPVFNPKAAAASPAGLAAGTGDTALTAATASPMMMPSMGGPVTPGGANPYAALSPEMISMILAAHTRGY